MLVHGGQLAKVATQYNISASDWLDLSTGIAAYHYPINDTPPALYQQLPQHYQPLIDAASSYYRYDSLLVTNGSQSIIKLLPQLWQQQVGITGDAFIPRHGYKEHQLAWSDAQYVIHHYDNALPAIESLTQHCVVVVINPNNPTGKLFSREELQCYQQAIKKRDGLLVIDEAFIDVIEPEQSMAEDIANNTIVLRSFGKFFGLAGIRIGFVLANPNWINTLSETIGPWQVNGPAQFIATQALSDGQWQQHQRQRLRRDANALIQLLHQQFNASDIDSINGTALFQTVNFNNHVDAKKLYERLCTNAVYVRLCDNQNSLRFGIPTPQQLVRLESVLSLVMREQFLD